MQSTTIIHQNQGSKTKLTIAIDEHPLTGQGRLSLTVEDDAGAKASILIGSEEIDVLSGVIDAAALAIA